MESPPQKRENKMTAQLILLVIIIGLAAGMLSGLVGIGGGVILVPATIYFLGYDQFQAQGTSLGVLALPVVALAFYKYYIDGKTNGSPISFTIIGILAAGFVVGGFLGSSLALKLEKDTVRKIFAIVLFFTAFKMMGWDKSITGFFKGLFSG